MVGGAAYSLDRALPEVVSCFWVAVKEHHALASQWVYGGVVEAVRAVLAEFPYYGYIVHHIIVVVGGTPLKLLNSNPGEGV